MADPGIDIRYGEAGMEIAQHRPAVTGLLSGMTLAEALQRIPILLPICGNAQGIAATRAAAAALGDPEQHSDEHRRRLNREQALAAAWRLAIDWPLLCDHPPEMTGLKAVQQSEDPADVAGALLAFLPGLDQVRDMDALGDWIRTSACLGAVVVREAMELESAFASGDPCVLCADEPLVARTRDAFGAEPFDPLAPVGAGIEVGPLAMSRHPLIAQLDAGDRFGKLSSRLVAQLLDTLAIAGALVDDQPDETEEAWNESPGIGIGRAMTARGPVFHRVHLAPEDSRRVREWRVLAPTDWHFARSGPLLREGTSASCRQERGLELLVAGFDPCAPWTLRARGYCNA